MATCKKLFVLGMLVAAAASAQGLPTALPGQDWGGSFVNLTQQVVTQYGGILLQDGMTELAYLCGLLVLWEFVKWGMARFAAPHHGHFPLPLPEVMMIFLKTAVLAFFLNHYMVNFAGVGFSFHSMPMAFSQHITMLLDQAQANSLASLLSNPTALVLPPVNPLAIVDGMVYLAVNALMAIVSFCLFFLGGLGFVASGVFTVVGPIVIPWWLLRGHPNAWAWNWLQVMCAVASYRVFGAAINYIMSSIWIDFFTNTLAGDYSIASWLANGEVAVVLTLFFLLLTTMVPFLAAQIFNGAGSWAQAAGGAITGVASTAVSAVSAAMKITAL